MFLQVKSECLREVLPLPKGRLVPAIRSGFGVNFSDLTMSHGRPCGAGAPHHVPNILEGLASSEPAVAWDEFLRLCAPILYQVVGLYVRDADAAGDCFVFICERLARNRFARLRKFRIDGPASFSTWLRVVSRNLCLDWLRSAHGRNHMLQKFSQMPVAENGCSRLAEELPDSAPGPEALAVAAEHTEALRRAIKTLDAPERLLLRLRYDEELTLDQIARLTGMKNPQTADRRIRDVLTNLRGKIAGALVQVEQVRACGQSEPNKTGEPGDARTKPHSPPTRSAS